MTHWKPPCGTPGAVLDGPISTLPTKDGRQRARNKYAGQCASCGTYVAAGQGCIQKNDLVRRWQVYC